MSSKEKGMKGVEKWVNKELRTVNLKNKRLNKRFGKLLTRLATSPNKSIPGASCSWSETIASYRFFNNKDIDHERILSPHQDATLERIKQQSIVLIPQDTTEMNFSGRKGIEGMGPLCSESSQGFYVHASLAVTPERLCLGVVDVQTWSRESLGKSKDRNKKPIEEKESYCWVKGYEAANKIALAAPDTTIVSMADREGDIYELLEKMPSEENKAYWLVRSQHNRKLLESSGEAIESQLWEEVNKKEVLAEIEYELPAGKIYNRLQSKRKPRQSRIVKQEVRACTVHIKPSERRGKKLNPVTINVVHCREIDPPSEEERIEWFLLTSFRIDNAEAALMVISWYLCRWQIEVFFKTLKSGCTVEELQFVTLKATTNCVALYMIIAWRIMYLTMLGREVPDLDCSVVFEPNEWQSVYAIVTKRSPPKEAPKLKEIIMMIARLGGFLCRKSDGYPGPKVMWIGLQRMKDFTIAWEFFRSMEVENCV
jgi:hypothetical protein